MRMRLLSAGGLLVLMLALVAIPGGRAGAGPAGPSCFDPRTHSVKPATKSLSSPGTLTGTTGDDVLVGSVGHDVIKGLGGNDVICTSPAEDDVEGDDVDAGSGDDSIYGVGSLKGGSGKDVIDVYFEGSVGDGGSGNDQVTAHLGATAKGGSGDDYVSTEEGGTADGGSGNDVVIGHAAAALYGGSGKDWVGDYDGTPYMDCGSAYDIYDGATGTVRRCETSLPICTFPVLTANEVAVADVSAQCV